MSLKEGFTLLETLIAITILGVVLSILFSILSDSFGRLERLERNLEDFVRLREAVFLGRTEGVDIREETLKEYNVKVRIYRKGEMEFIELE